MIKGRFKKGHISWNNNKKGIHLCVKCEFKKGHIPWNKGLKGYQIHSEETKQKISKALKGRIFTEEHKRKLSEANKGHKPVITLERNQKISKANKGNTYTLGYHHTEEAKRKMSKAGKGRIFTKEHIKKILTRRIPTSLEEEFQNIINKNNLPYKFVGDGKFFIERYNPDFINTNNKKIAVEVYARYYKLRNNKTIEEWKEDRQKVFNKYGWKIMFFNEIEVNEKNVLEKI